MLFGARRHGGNGMIQHVVVRYKNGKIVRGTTSDFKPNQVAFTVAEESLSGIAHRHRIVLEDLKAIFFVKALTGNPEHNEQKMRLPKNPMGKRLMITFQDGESIRGTSLGVNLNMPGFLLFPADTESNNKRIFVIKSAVREIREEG